MEVEEATNRIESAETWVCANGHEHGLTVQTTPWNRRGLSHGDVP